MRPTFLHPTCLLAILPVLVATLSTARCDDGYHAPYFADPARLEKIRPLFPVVAKMYGDYAAENHFPGYAFGIILDGKLVYSGAGGYTDLNKKTLATTASMFRIASMSKSFTAMAILKLRDEGKLRLDDPVELCIPEMKGQRLTGDAPLITLRDLLTHSAGFPEDNPWGDRQLEAREEDLRTLIKKGILFSNDPGIAYEYSNLGFAMLGQVIKKVSGISYEDYIARNIWQPLQMTQAEWEYTKVAPAQLAHGYRWIDNSWKEEPLLHDGVYGAMGGMITSVESFSKYVALHLSAWPPRSGVDDGPVKRSSLREMHQPWRFISLLPDYKYPGGRVCAVSTAYGYGLGWVRDCEGRVMVSHSGGLPGFGSNWRILPDYGLGAVLFANVTYAPANPANLNVLDTLIKRAQLKPRQLPASALLKQRQAALIKLLPGWKNATASGLFAQNFFLDSTPESLSREATALFEKSGPILRIGEIIPENQMRGSFVLEGAKGNLQIYITLAPEAPGLIQEYKIKEVAKP